MPGKVVIKRERRILDDFFKVDELIVSHEQIDGSMSADQRRLQRTTPRKCAPCCAAPGTRSPI